MDLRQLEYFVHVVESGSFSRAAVALNLARSTTSAVIGAGSSVTAEVGPCPWNGNHRLMRVGLQGRHVDTRELADRFHAAIEQQQLGG